MARTTSPKVKKTAGVAQERKTGDVVKGVKRKKKPQESFSVYIHQVLKGVHKEIQISSEAMSIMNCFVNDIFYRIADEAACLTKYSKKKTISEKVIESATKLVLNGQLAKHAVDKGRKAIQRFNEPEESD